MSADKINQIREQVISKCYSELQQELETLVEASPLTTTFRLRCKTDADTTKEIIHRFIADDFKVKLVSSLIYGNYLEVTIDLPDNLVHELDLE